MSLQRKATLGEGSTPLVPSVMARGLSFKLESCNPSGSYKDRFTAAEVSRLLEIGAKSCVATSSGNTGASLAAYCARYGIRAVVLVNQHAPAGKLAQMQAHGAQVVRIPEFTVSPAVTDDVFATLMNFSSVSGVPLVISAYRYCPEGMRGVSSIAWELQPHAPEHIFVPIGGGGLYSAIVEGFASMGGRMPRVHGVQSSGCLTVVASYLRGDDEIRPVESTTKISGLSVPTDIDGSMALALLEACDGTGISVTDDEVWAAQRLLLEREGIYAEPAGAAAFAGWQRALQEGVARDGENSVCLVTGHGFKDIDSIQAAAQCHPEVSMNASGLASGLRQMLARA